MKIEKSEDGGEVDGQIEHLGTAAWTFIHARTEYDNIPPADWVPECSDWSESALLVRQMYKTLRKIKVK